MPPEEPEEPPSPPPKPDSFYTRPEKELCRAAFTGCLQNVQVMLYCPTEQIALLACSACYQEWRRLVGTAPQFAVKCPNCAHHNYDFARRPEIPQRQVPALQGRAADAIDRAMHKESLTVDVRQAVLRNLYRDAFWLSDPDSDPQSQQSQQSQAVP